MFDCSAFDKSMMASTEDLKSFDQRINPFLTQHALKVTEIKGVPQYLDPIKEMPSNQFPTLNKENAATSGKDPYT